MKKMVWMVVISLVVGVGAYVGVSYLTGSGGTTTPPDAPLPNVVGATPPTAPRENAGKPFLDTSMLKPPVGAKVAIVEWDDLECPGCAMAYPMIEAVAEQDHVPVVHYDYPWFFHKWSFDAAVVARYLKDKVSKDVATKYRRDVFANQRQIESKDDLGKFDTDWFGKHALKMPVVMDPDGKLKAEVQADLDLGQKLGLASTPCIFVVTANGFTYVQDARQLGSLIAAKQ